MKPGVFPGFYFLETYHIFVDRVFLKIVVVNYNNAAYIGQCLDSIAKQTSANWKCVVVDD